MKWQVSLHFVFLRLDNFSSISKNVPELILESVVHKLMFLAKTNELYLYVMLRWEGVEGRIWSWDGRIDEAEFYLKADRSSFEML